MGGQNFQLATVHAIRTLELRDFLAIGFRQRRLMALCLAGVFLGAALAAFSLPRQYTAHTKLLVKREREDAVVTTATLPQLHRAVTEDETNC